MGKQVPIVDYLVLDDGAPHLVANRCDNCGALYFDRRNAVRQVQRPVVLEGSDWPTTGRCAASRSCTGPRRASRRRTCRRSSTSTAAGS